MGVENLLLDNVPVEKALAMYLAALSPHWTRDCEEICVVDSLDRVTAAAISARINSPLYDAAAMDGIAVVSARTQGAGEEMPITLCKGADFIAVDTGDPVQAPFDSVIMAEHVEELADGRVRIRNPAAPGKHVRPMGEDIARGNRILSPQHRIRPVDIGGLLSGGITNIDVLRRPAVAIFPTGTELVEPGCKLKMGDIIESNSRVFVGLVTEGGGIPSRFPPIIDDFGTIKREIERAAAAFDMVLINAGSSAGREDYTVHVLRELGEVVVHGVAMKPGRPVILAIISGKPVIGLPGYPVAAYLGYQNFAAPVLAGLAGRRQPDREMIRAVITDSLESAPAVREYVRVTLKRDGDKLMASPLMRGAGSMLSLVQADGFCILDRGSAGVEAGREVDIWSYPV